jgi:preprotein translocase subunit SecG
MFVLLQPGKSDAAAVFGGGANSSAFGPRGTQTVLAKVTITAAILFFLIAFLFSIPGLFDKRSLGEGEGPAEPAPATPVTPVSPTETVPGSIQPATQPGVVPPTPADANANKQSKPAESKNAAKPESGKKK